MNDTSDTWQWKCVTATEEVSCQVSKKLVCHDYDPVQMFNSQPAVDSATGCEVGTYEDRTDNDNLYSWSCKNEQTGVERYCGVLKAGAVGDFFPGCNVPNVILPSGQIWAGCNSQLHVTSAMHYGGFAGSSHVEINEENHFFGGLYAMDDL